MTNKYVILSDVAEVFNGKTPSKKEQRGNGYPVLKIKDVNGNGYFLGNFNSFVDIDFYNKNKEKRIKIGDTLILNAAHSSEYVGTKQYFADNSVVDSIATGEWLIVRPISEKIDRSFVHYWLRSAETFFKIKKLVKGIHLYPKDVQRLKIPLLSLTEQKRIAAILDKANAIRRKREKAIQLADEFLRSVFLDIFGDPVVNPKGWNLFKFSEVGTLDRGKSKHRPRNAPELLGGKYPLIQTGDVANSDGYISNYTQTYSKLGLKQSRMWPAGTLCITIAANIAKTGILTFDACFPDSIVGFTPNDNVQIEYVQFWMSFLQKILEDTAPESAQKNINLRILRDLDIPLPNIKLQNQFANIVGKVETMKSKIKYKLNNSHKLFNSITRRAFRGEM